MQQGFFSVVLSRSNCHSPCKPKSICSRSRVYLSLTRPKCPHRNRQRLANMTRRLCACSKCHEPGHKDGRSKHCALRGARAASRSIPASQASQSTPHAEGGVNNVVQGASTPSDPRGDRLEMDRPPEPGCCPSRMRRLILAPRVRGVPRSVGYPVGRWISENL